MADPNPSKVVTNPRIAKLIELEVSGRIKPEHQQELDTYRAMGAAPKKSTGSLTEAQGKSAGFYERAIGANRDFEATGAATKPRSILGAAGAAIAPEAITNSLSSPDRQTAEQAKEDFIRASLRYESGAAIGKDEFVGQDRIFFPQPGDGKAVIAQKAAARQRVIDSLKLASGPGAASVQTPTAKQPEQQALVAPPAIGSGDATTPAPLGPNNVLPSSQDGGPPLAPTAMAISPGDTKTEIDPTLAGLNSRVAGMIKSGASSQEVKAYLGQAGVDPSRVNVDQVIAFRDKNPGYKGAYAVQLDQRDVPLGGAEKALATVGASPVGAGVIAAGDAATAGSLPAIVGFTGGNRLQAQAAEDALGAANPLSTMAGSIIGGVPTALGGSMLAGGTRLGALGGGLAADALYGGVYGANKDLENPARGFGEGTLTGALASGVGQGAVNVAGRVLSPSGGKLGALYENGVRPTLGQRFRGTGVVGNAVNGLEEAFQSIPVAGFAIRGARQKARDQFQRGAFDSALGDIPERLGTPRTIGNADLGTQPHAIMQGAFNDAYDQVKGDLHFTPDADYVTDHAAFNAGLDNGLLDDTEAKQVRNLISKAVDGRVTNAGGAITGDAFKAADSDLTGAISKFGDKPRIADALSQYKSIFDDAMRRNSAPEAVEALDAVDKGYAKSAIIEDAARRRGTDTGMFTPTQFDAAVQNSSGGVRSRRYLRGDALFGDYAEAGKSLTDVIPNSGTPERLMATQAALGAPAMGALGFASPVAAGSAALGALAYAPIARDIVAGSLAPRQNATIRTLGDLLRSNPVALGLGGASATVPASQWLLGDQ